MILWQSSIHRIEEIVNGCMQESGVCKELTQDEFQSRMKNHLYEYADFVERITGLDPTECGKVKRM